MSAQAAQHLGARRRLKKQIMVVLLTAIIPSFVQSSFAASESFQCFTHVDSYSNHKKMGDGDFSPSVLWRDVTVSKTTIGYGPSGHREDEVTIIDGQIFMAHPGSKDEVIVTNKPNPDKGQAMLQIASPTAWGEAATLDEIGSFDDLNFVLDDQSDEMECGDNVLLPFKIVGYANKVIWSLDTQPKHLVTNSNNQEVTIVGIYNRDQKEKYFMVRGYNLHAHVLLKAINEAGHLRDLELAEGAKLYLPR